jgi:27-O-demethylrifamycin SV methyltransferase
MGAMNRLSRWMVDRTTEGRARRTLDRLGMNLRIPEGARVLELGSGGGGMVALLQERYRPARLVGTDFDPVQVERAREFLSARWGAIPDSVELQSADASQLPFPDASFDFVFALVMLHHIDDHLSEYVRRPKALQEIRRVLAPGGRLVYSELVAREKVRGTLKDLGFAPEFVRSGWRSDLAIQRSPA